MEQPETVHEGRRKVLKTLAYVPPAILTLQVAPALATTGSPIKKDKYKKGRKYSYGDPPKKSGSKKYADYQGGYKGDYKGGYKDDYKRDYDYKGGDKDRRR